MWKEDEVVGVGVVGYGYWGPNLARNFAEAEAAQLVAVCDMDPAKLGLAKRRHPAAVITREFSNLLTDSRIDAVAIATPVQLTARKARNYFRHANGICFSLRGLA
jgi:predicted dehydrogenase